MRAPTRPGGRPRRPGPPDRIRATGTRRRRPLERQAPDPGPRATWVFALVVLVMGVGMIVFIASAGSGPRLAAAPTATPTAVPWEPSPSPTTALAVTGDGDGGAAASPGRTSTVPETPGPSRAPARPDGEAALSVEFPKDGEVVISRRINVFGRAPGGARVLRELPDGAVESSVARPDGLWILGVELEPGTTELRFRVDGEDALVVVRVTYQPR